MAQLEVPKTWIGIVSLSFTYKNGLPIKQSHNKDQDNVVEITEPSHPSITEDTQRHLFYIGLSDTPTLANNPDVPTLDLNNKAKL